MKYSFFNRHYFSNDGEFHFSKEQYALILEYCFAQSTVFSLQFVQSTDLSDTLRKWEIKKPDFPYQNESHPECRHYYCANPATHDLLLQNASSIFDFCNLQQHPYPEDLVFYRSDGSVVLDSVAHEGECSIYPHSVEEVAAILGQGHWLFMENGNCFEEGVPVAPAKEHQLPPSPSWNLFDDPLYHQLVDLPNALRYLQDRRDILCVLSFVDGYLQGVNNSPFLQFPPHGPTYTPPWWIAFRLYVLGACNATTNMDILDALKLAGFEGEDAYLHFFALLSAFAKSYSAWLISNTR